MEFTVEAGDLAGAAQYAASAAPVRAADPVLASLKITAGDGGVALTGSDGDSTATATADATVSEPGEVLVPRLLAEIAKGLPAGQPVTFAVPGPGDGQDALAVIECGRARYQLVTASATLYPQMPQPGEPLGTVPGDLLIQAVARASVAVSREDAVQALMAVQVVLDSRLITLSATDRYTLAQVTVPWAPAGPVDEIPPLLPSGRELAALVKSIPAEKDVQIGVAFSDAGTPSALTLSAPGRSASVRVLGGEFPPIARQFAFEVAGSAVMSRRDLAEAAARVAHLADRGEAVHFEFTPGWVNLEAGGKTGKGGDSVAADLGESEGVSWPAFFAERLKGVLDGAGTERVRIGWTRPRRPLLFTDGEEDERKRDTSYRYLLMPVWQNSSQTPPEEAA
jgi:DNA polymerase III subunit beta